MKQIKQKPNCNIVYNKIYDITNVYMKICKRECITNSCRRRKEEVLGDLLDLYKSLEYCKK